MAPGRIPFHGTESCMECFHISLESQAVGTMVCPQGGTQRIVHLHRQCLSSPRTVRRETRHYYLPLWAVFQARFDWRSHLYRTVPG